VTDSHFLWHIFSSTVKWLFIMNFVSNCQFFSLERCNKAIQVSATRMTPFLAEKSQCSYGCTHTAGI
ncbi:MAG: hypothetical protein ACR5LB_10450, partial [Wolbachia sp.]